MELNIAFLLGQQNDKDGRSVQQYLSFSETDWEFQHDVIQMAFPTQTQSAFHPNQPFLASDFNAEDLSADELQRVRATISLLLHSYLNSLNVEFLIIGGKSQFHLKHSYPQWAKSSDHNTLRLTRILECLGIFGMTEIQQALGDFLLYRIAFVFHTHFNAKTVAYWVAAKDNKLHVLR